MNTNFLGAVLAIVTAALLLCLREVILRIGKPPSQPMRQIESKSKYPFEIVRNKAGADLGESPAVESAAKGSSIPVEQFLVELRAKASKPR